MYREPKQGTAPCTATERGGAGVKFLGRVYLAADENTGRFGRVWRKQESGKIVVMTYRKYTVELEGECVSDL
jgi:hypothetical protein